MVHFVKFIYSPVAFIGVNYLTKLEMPMPVCQLLKYYFKLESVSTRENGLQ
jgi:hypothetical protein